LTFTITAVVSVHLIVICLQPSDHNIKPQGCQDKFRIRKHIKIYMNTRTSAWIAAILSMGLAVLLFFSGTASAENRDGPEKKATIVLDPGHGGKDAGVSGASGVLEKQLTLKWCRQIAAMLADCCNVVLTRDDDYTLDLFSRSATANRYRARATVSLHTGGNQHRQVRGMHVFYYQPAEGDTFPINPSAAIEALGETEAVAWKHAQLPYGSASRRLAQMIREQLHAALPHTQVRMSGAPLGVLEGVAAPAVLVEMGYLTHPVEEKQITSEEGSRTLLSALAQAIRRFVDSQTDAPR